MPELKALTLVCAVVLLVLLGRGGRLPPFLALLITTVVFGLAVQVPFGPLANSFGQGFAQAVAGIGLVIVAAAVIGTLARGSGASMWLQRATARWSIAARTRTMTLAGLLGGAGGQSAAAFVLLSPLREAVGPSAPGAHRAVALRTALATSAGHGLLWPSPVVVSATAILHADAWRVLACGVPAALVALLAGAVCSARFVRAAGPDGGAGASTGDAVGAGTGPMGGEIRDDVTDTRVPPRAGSASQATVLVAVTVLLLVMLTVQSLGGIPSEPLGGGGTREALLGSGRPLTLLAVGAGLMWLTAPRIAARLSAPGGPLQAALAAAAGLVLVVGAAGGLQTLTQQTGMAELLAEKLLDRQVGLALPFVLAALIKLLQGSSLVAVITAAGMTQPLLAALGLDDDTGRALACLALGAGAMAGSHINDVKFWLVADATGLRPRATLGFWTGGTLVQGLAALATLALLSIVVR